MKRFLIPKFFSRSLLVGLTLFLLASPQMLMAEETVIRFVNWASAEAVTRETINSVIKEFESRNPGIKIKNVAIPFGQIRTQVITMTAGGNAPEVMQVSGNLPFELAGMGALADLKEFASSNYIDDNWPGAISASMYNDELINVPWAVTPFGFWYNKNLMKQAGLDAPPTSWSDFEKHLDLIKSEFSGKGIDSFELFTAKAGYSVVHNWSLMWAFGAFPMENNKAGFNTPEMKKFFNWYRKMIQDKYTTGGFKLREFRDELAKERLVYGFDGPYVQGMVKKLNSQFNDDNLSKTFGIATLPAGIDGKSRIALDFHALAMSKQTKNKEAAWKFIKFLTSSDAVINKYLLPMGAILPLKSSVKKFDAQFNTPINQAFINHVLPNVRGIPYGPNWGQASPFILNALQTVAFTDKSIDDIAAQLDQTVTAIYGW